MADSPHPETPAAPTQVGAGIDFADPNSPLALLYFRTIHVVAVGFLAILFVVNTIFPLWHTDVWGHVRYGQWMVEHRAIPDREPFSIWWDGRQRFTQFYTVSHLVMYFVYAVGTHFAGGDDLSQLAGGVEALRFLHAFLVVARYGLLYVAFGRIGRSWPVAFLGMIAVMMLDLSNMAVFRPQSFGQVFFALLLIPLGRDVLSRRAMVFIPLLTALWANTHGSYLVVHGLLFALAAGRIADCLFPTTGPAVRPWKDAQAVRLTVTLGLVFLAVCLNPYGPGLYSRTFEMTRHPSLITAVGEWQPMSFTMGRGWHWPFLGSLAVLAVAVLLSRQALPYGRLFTLFLFGVGVCVQNRMVIWWAMVVPWVLVPMAADMASRIPERFLPTASVPSLRKTMLAVLVALAIANWSGLADTLRNGVPKVEDTVSAGTPWQVARQIAKPEAELQAEWQKELRAVLNANYGGTFRGAILATPMQGDYLMWALAPAVPVTYAHIHLFHPDFWDELGVVGQGRPGWWDIVDKYEVNLMVVEAEYCDSLLAELRKRPGVWKVLLDETGSPEKTQPLNRQLIVVRIKPV
ncbi:hypothetical protein [Limnoglobus roseus]|uniref:Uncharacterized protein n=1 Tax=Limnoglobus roseus TaxID=2598579 RepID=A0A5C1A4K0_9BACT|nr:hypothetical protein [Limnoglobus roseus]QEL13253.1 hypothetical protein PX52LOC_00107 [Limnoglobus roseus]